jgi:hypothetical protein
MDAFQKERRRNKEIRSGIERRRLNPPEYPGIERLCAELSIMAGFGIRAIVEAICKDNEMEGRNLQQKIDSLVNAGLITQAGATILHNLRFMGNAAAHEMKAHAPKELNAAFDAVDYLLKGVYILPKQAQNLPSASS